MSAADAPIICFHNRELRRGAVDPGRRVVMIQSSPLDALHLPYSRSSSILWAGMQPAGHSPIYDAQSSSF